MIGTDTKYRNDFLAGGGEMAARIRAFDWTATPLGPIHSWPQSLKTSVSLILGSRHPMWIGWGPEMIFLYNDAYLHVLGAAKHPHALGRPASQVWSEIWDVCGPLADKVLASGEASFVDDVRLFMDRGDFLEETFYSFSYSPIRDESGEVAGLFCPSTDVTSKVLHARRLRTLSELAATALTEKTLSGACGVAAHTLARNPDDVPFALLYLADARGDRIILEESVGEFSGDPARSVIVASDGNGSGWPIAEVFRTARRATVPVTHITGPLPGVAGRPVSQAVVLPVTSRGEHKPYGVLVAGVNPCRPLDDDHFTFFDLIAGQLATAIQNARAVEDEKKRADALAEIDRAKTVFFSNVSHEFRTPLTLMLGPLEGLLARADALPGEDREQLAIAHRNSLRLLKLVNSLLDFSRIEAGRIKASYVPTDLAALTADLASNFRSAMQAGGLTLEVDCRALSEPVYVDRDMWEKIVLNLLSNAFKFTFSGRVTVRLRSSGDNAVLSISDTGIGIPETELPRVFERFHRIEGSRGRTYEGTGIGLALVQELVKLHGGIISVSSRVGEGSTFEIAIPFGSAHLTPEHVQQSPEPPDVTALRAEAFTGEALTWLPPDEDPSAPSEAAADFSESAAPARKPRILLADDNADMREYVRHILGPNYELLTADDGRRALELLRRDPPDLLLTDMMMPDLDGFELLKAVRAEEATRTLPVIFISARAGEDMRVEGLQAGADDYLVKPFTANELRARVGTHMKMALNRRRAIEREAALRSEAEAARDSVVQVLESVTDGFVALDRDWRITFVNAEAERLNGMRREEMLGKNHWELFPGAVGTTIHRELLRAAEQRRAVEFENYYAPWKRWFHVKAYPAAEGGVSLFYEDVTDRKAAEQERAALLEREREAREEAEALHEISRALAGELDHEKIVQRVTDAATRLTGAEYGSFFYNVVNERGESYTLYTLTGAERQDFEPIGLPRNTPLFAPTFAGTGVVRCDDVYQHPDFGKNPPHNGMPEGHLPCRSYLAVPVISRSGEALGGLFFAHSQTGMFTERSERLAVAIASNAAVAIDNARLFAKAEHEIVHRTQVERALRDSERRFREMIDALAAAIYTTDAEGRLTHFNPAAITLSGRVPELGTDQWCVTWKLFRSDGTPLPHRECPMAEVLSGREVRGGQEVIAERPDGRRFWFTPYPTPLRDSEGRITGGINMLVDITERKAAEEALRQSEERFRGVFESSAVGVAVLDIEGRFLQANSAFCSITGYSEAELRDLDAAALTHPDDRAAMADLMARLVSGEIPTFVLEKRYFTKDGRTIWVQNSVSLMRDALGRPEHFIKLCEDITARVEAQSALRESEERFRAIVETSPECIKLVASDGTLLQMNSSGLSMVDAERVEDVLGRSVYDLIAPEFRDAFRELNERVCRGEKGSVEFDIIGLRGRRRHMATNAAPLRSSDGRTVQLAITRDITARKRAEEAVRASEARFRQLADSMPQMVWTARPDGSIDYYNERWYEFTGCSRDTFNDESWRPVVHPEDAQKAADAWMAAVAAGNPFHIECRLRDGRENRWRWFMARAVPVRDDSGHIVKWFGATTDIDEQKRVQDELRRANQDLEQFAYSASHDLQEPLRGLKIYSDLLARRYASKLDSKGLEFLGYLRGGATRMEMLVRDLLAYTQVTRLEPGEVTTDANEALMEALANLKEAIGETGVQITSDRLPALPVHHTHLQQLFLNLVGNAIKYRDRDRIPVVHVGAAQQEGFWIISVSDNGIGIEPEYKERIFGIFKRLHTGNQYSGTGIGLAICQRIVERYHGRIWVDSEPGRGSKFFFAIPS